MLARLLPRRRLTRMGSLLAALLVTTAIGLTVSGFDLGGPREIQEDGRGGDGLSQSTRTGIPGFGQDPILRLFDESEPMLLTDSARVVSPSDAANFLAYDIFLPRESDGAEAPEVWVDQAAGDGAARYSDGVVLLFRPLSDGEDPSASLTELARSWGVGYVTEVGGYPAWVVEEGSQDGERPLVPFVWTVYDRTEIRIFAQRPIEELLEIAAHLQRIT